MERHSAVCEALADTMDPPYMRPAMLEVSPMVATNPTGPHAFPDAHRCASPDKPKPVRRYSQVLQHFERLLRSRGFIEAITRPEMDDYKVRRLHEQSQRHRRLITPRTINFEISTGAPFSIT